MEKNRVFYYFEEISKIPRESYNEGAIADYLLEFAKDHNLKAFKDEHLNVTIVKEADKGYENRPGIILQGHTDMVCEKTIESSHDFAKDPLELIYDENFLKAKDTSLGADNGVAIAYALAILEDKTLKTPKLEFVATSMEEVGLLGAKKYEPGQITGKYLLNFDAEREGRLICGCAGGMTIKLFYDLNWLDVEGNVYSIALSNLRGGHSGMDIHQDILSSIKCGGELMAKIMEENNINIIDIDAGNKHNAIPRDLYIKFSSDKKINFEILNDLIHKFKEKETNMAVDFEDYGELKVNAIDKEISKNVISAINSIPHGPYAFLDDPFSDVVDTSLNLATVNIINNKIVFYVSIRSINLDVNNELAKKVEKISLDTNANIEKTKPSKGWAFDENSKLRDITLEAYKEFTGKDMKVTIIHAGIETGIFADKYPGLDPISFGPNIYNLHSPDEKLDIASTNRIYEFIRYLITKLSKEEQNA